MPRAAPTSWRQRERSTESVCQPRDISQRGHAPSASCIERPPDCSPSAALRCGRGATHRRFFRPEPGWNLSPRQKRGGKGQDAAGLPQPVSREHGVRPNNAGLPQPPKLWIIRRANSKNGDSKICIPARCGLIASAADMRFSGQLWT